MKKSPPFERVSVLLPIQLVAADLKNRWKDYLKLLSWLWLMYFVVYTLSHSTEWGLDFFLNTCLFGVFFSFGALFFFLLIWVTFKVSLILLLKRPRYFIGGVGIFVFLMLLGIHWLKWQLGAFTPFQNVLLLPMLIFDFFCLGAIAFQTSEKMSRFSSSSRTFTFLLVYHAVFLNITTVASNVVSWNDFLPFVYLLGFLDLLFVAAMVSSKKKK